MPEISTNRAEFVAHRLAEDKKQLDAEGISYRLQTPTHIKIDAYNYYPTTGTITKDGDASKVGRGISELLLLLKTSNRMP